MASASGEAVNVLAFLLPGFVAAGVFHSLASHPKSGAFDRLIQALVFTVIVNAIIFGVSSAADLTLEEGWIPVLAVSISVMLALMTVYRSNNDTMHGILRRFGITKETSCPSEWYSTFWRLNDCYVVLHMKGNVVSMDGLKSGPAIRIVGISGFRRANGSGMMRTMEHLRRPAGFVEDSSGET